MAPAGKVAACTDCHVGNNYTFTVANTDCYGCHQAAWQSTTTLGGAVPNHVTAGFLTAQCSTCHDTLLWADGKFDHSTTGFALQGAHVTTPCASCHVSSVALTAANTDCYGCHQAAWQSTTTLGGAVPNHVAALYPTTCLTCHTTWASEVLTVEAVQEQTPWGTVVGGRTASVSNDLADKTNRETLSEAIMGCRGVALLSRPSSS